MICEEKLTFDSIYCKDHEPYGLLTDKKKPRFLHFAGSFGAIEDNKIKPDI